MVFKVQEFVSLESGETVAPSFSMGLFLEKNLTIIWSYWEPCLLKSCSSFDVQSSCLQKGL